MDFKSYLDSLIQDEIFTLELQINELKTILDESKKVGYIYHFTELPYLEPILKSGFIKVSGKNTDNTIKFISLTRNFRLPETSSYFGKFYPVRFTIDGDKLSENMSVTPFQDPNYSYKEESEEVVFKNIKLSKYLKCIDIKLGQFDDAEKIRNLCKKYNINVNFVKKWNIIN